MNYYERVQKAIDYIEENLESQIDLQTVSLQAYMSLANLYRLFFSMTGFTIKEYIRKRRISEAAICLLSTNQGIIDTSIRYCFDSQEAFTRAFKQLTGITPGVFRRSKENKYRFERVNIMEKYYDIQDSKLLEEYPDIKVIKELQPMRVAYYRHIGIGPEGEAWKVLLAWIRKAGLDKKDSKMRVFGFDNPPPAPNFVPGETEYGYEFMVTIDDDIIIDDELVKEKTFEGGRYAVMSISKVSGNGIMSGWKRFNKWLSSSKYLIGTHQWLEEHLSFEEEDNENMKIDLYMPLSDKDKTEFENKINIIPQEKIKVAYYRAHGEQAWNEAWKVMLKWAEENGYFKGNEPVRFINYCSIPTAYPGTPKFWFEVCIEIGHETKVDDGGVKAKEFSGGLYACVESNKGSADDTWAIIEKWMFANEKYTFSSSHQWFQEQWLDKPVCFEALPASYPVSCCMSVKQL